MSLFVLIGVGSAGTPAVLGRVLAIAFRAQVLIAALVPMTAGISRGIGEAIPLGGLGGFIARGVACGVVGWPSILPGIEWAFVILAHLNRLQVQLQVDIGPRQRQIRTRHGLAVVIIVEGPCRAVVNSDLTLER